jgi:uncharacterized protein (TIGR02453 family)
MTISKDTFQFLKDIKKNNDREWFAKNKAKFVAANENFIQFVQKLISDVSKFDKSLAGKDAKDSVFRIYRDTRFANDKTPYKTNFGAVLHGRKTGCNQAGYYLQIEPGGSFIVGGVHQTDPEFLKAIREDISDHSKEFMKIINNKTFTSLFEIEGEKLVNVPRGFDKEDPMADFLKYKELMITHNLSDKDVLSENFSSYLVKVVKAMGPFNEFLNRAGKQ